ncbi:hypothetical protein [Couchioplanes caeruleus]|uniref:Uncharacterized protein n=1 Tax=Couchioplanes caeruleus TaxID=56438 RepID=A0A3N1GM41_9ACTN|nr:hypothetical protein [Couchioplanes caeruleus]ROP31300.1 hypothetical protein EDD30_4195 [Couchioplanes caeruleus]
MIRARLAADDVDELHAAAAAVVSALTVIRTSRTVPRRFGDGLTVHLDAECPATAPPPGRASRSDDLHGKQAEDLSYLGPDPG